MSVTITAVTRKALGKGGARKARAAGLVPGIMYGAVKEPIPVSLQGKDLQQLLSGAGESGLIEVVLTKEDGHKLSTEKAIIRHVEYDPTRDVPIHVDFLAVSMDKKLTLSVPVELVGIAVGVSVNKGMMSQIVYQLEVECLPSSIPHAIKVDVTPLDLGQSLHVGDLPPLEGVRILTGKEQTIVTVEAPKAEEEAPVAAAPEEAAAEPEVITKRKEEEPAEG